VIFICQSNDVQSLKIPRGLIKIKNLDLSVYYLKNVLYIARFKKIGKVFNELFHCIIVIYYLLLLRSKIVYSDHAIIIGSGSMKAQLENLIIKNNAISDIMILGDISHQTILHILNKTDIYISLNRFGNLSNSNLEAMSAGKAIIMLRSKPREEIDIYTDKIIPKSAVYRVSSSNYVEEIANAIIYLYSNRSIRLELGRNIKRVSSKFIHSWERRIQWESSLLEILDKKSPKELEKVINKI